MSDSGEDLVRTLIQAIKDQTIAQQSQTAAINDQVRAIDDLVASNDRLMLEMVERTDEEEGESHHYLDGTPK